MIAIKEVRIYEKGNERREFRTYFDDECVVSVIISNNDYDNALPISDSQRLLLQKVIVDSGYTLVYADMPKDEKYVQ